MTSRLFYFVGGDSSPWRVTSARLLAKQQGLGLLLMLASCIVFYVGAYSIRSTTLEQLNKVEPVQLKLSAAMVFFFFFFHLQHHKMRFPMESGWNPGVPVRGQRIKKACCTWQRAFCW